MIEIMLLLLTYSDILFNYDDSLVIGNSIIMINVE